MEEIRGITWDLWGVELTHEQTIQRIARAGFPIWRLSPQTGNAESPLLTMFAIVEGESGEYTKAWHMNVERQSDGSILRSVDGKMHARSIDLGFMQFNVTLPPSTWLDMTEDVVKTFVEEQFAGHPNLAVPQDAADAAFERWLRDGYKPWYAYANRTPEGWHTKLKEALVGFDAWLIHSFIGKDADGKLPKRIWA